ncbi:MAG: hypothetical protein ACYS6W_00430 [Planctomycetota bacterium]|jgi:hypothetical protein
MMNNQLPTVICLLPSVFRIFTTVKDSLQISSFMQNKPNFRKSQMNVSAFSQKAYENMSDWTLGKNKPNQTQSPQRNFTAINLKKPKIHLSRMVCLPEKFVLFSNYSRFQWLL